MAALHESGGGPPVAARVDLAWVVVPDGRRRLRDVGALADSIAKVGLLNPITVGENGRLIAGYHRLEACRALGWTTIPATVVSLTELEAELAEIDENLIRNDLTVLERAEETGRRKAVYEALYPDAKAGVKRATGMHLALGHDVGATVAPTFTKDTAAKTGAAVRTVQEDVQIATKIADEVKEIIRPTEVADSKRELIALARLPQEAQRVIAEKIVRGEVETVREGKQAIKREERDRQAAEIAVEPPPLPTGPFRVIVADPPWTYGSRADDGTHRAANPYPSMDLDAIKALPVGEMAHEDCILWLWTTNAHMRQAFEVLDAWGFAPKTILTWVKDRMGTGDWLRGQSEHCLLAVRGSPTHVLTNQTTVIHGPLREHSRKPEAFFQLVEALCPGSKCELFAREARNGWHQHGNAVS